MTDRLSALPRELLVDLVLPHAVEKGFLPGLAGTSRSLRAASLELARKLVLRKVCRQSEQAAALTGPERRQVTTSFAAYPTLFREREAQDFLDRARRHAATGLFESARDFAHSKSILFSSRHDGDFDLDEFSAHLAHVQNRFREAVELSDQNAALCGMIADFWADVARQQKPNWGYDGGHNAAYRAVGAALEMVPDHSEVLHVLCSHAPESAFELGINGVLAECGVLDAKHLLNYLEARFDDPVEGPKSRAFFGLVLTATRPSNHPEHRRGRALLANFVEKHGNSDNFPSLLLHASSKLLSWAIEQHDRRNLEYLFTVLLRADWDPQMHWCGDLTETIFTEHATAFGKMATLALVEALDGTSERERNAMRCAVEGHPKALHEALLYDTVFTGRVRPAANTLVGQ